MTAILTPPQQEWVDALRYGDYSQAKGHMHNSSHQFCCLGVACDISGLGQWTKLHLGIHRFHVAEGTNSAHFLPQQVAQRLDMNTPHGEFRYTDQIRHQLPARIRVMIDQHATLSRGHRHALLDSLNDAGMTFADIADVIEAAADQLFSAATRRSAVC